MTTEEKQLLLKDLCARIPYDPFIKIGNNPNLFKLSTRLNWIVHYGVDGTIEEAITDSWSVCKPYLRPMSSMTDEEQNEFEHLKFRHDEEGWLDFVLSKHLDWRRLILMNLALEAPEGMYKTE